MATRFLDSVAHYATAQIGGKYEISSYQAAVGAYGRLGTNALYLAGDPSYCIRAIGADLGTIYMGARLSTGYFGADSGRIEGLACWDGPTLQIGMAFDSAGRLCIMRGATKLHTSSFTYGASTLRYFEMMATIHPSAGAVQVKVDGTLVVDISAVNTSASGTSVCNRHGVMHQGNTALVAQDLYMNDTTGSAPNNGFLGDIKVGARFPTTTDGATTGTVTGAATAHEATDEATPNGSTDYVSLAASGDLVRVGFASGAFGANPAQAVLAAQVNALVTKDDAGPNLGVASVRSGAVSSDGATFTPILNQWFYALKPFDRDPDGGATLTVADMDAMLAEYRRTS